MPREGLETLYPEDDALLFPDETDAYLSNLEPTDTFKTAEELNTQGGAAVADLLERAREAIRLIEVKRRAIGYYAAVAARYTAEFPEAVAKLSPDNRTGIEELAARGTPARTEQDQEVTIIRGRQTDTVHLPPEPQGE